MLGSFIMPVMQMVDAAIVPLRLQAGGLPVREATALFGQHAGMAFSLVALPTVATRALTTALVPDIASALARGNETIVRARVAQALNITIALALPAAVGLFMLAEPICQLLFGVAAASIPLRWLAFGTVGLCLMETNSSLLHALGRGRGAVVALFIGGVVNAAIDYYVCALPELNIRGAALGTGLGFCVAAILTLVLLQTYVVGIIKPRMLLGPVLASALMMPCVHWAYDFGLSCGWPKVATLVTAVAAGAVSYMVGAGSWYFWAWCLIACHQDNNKRAGNTYSPAK